MLLISLGVRVEFATACFEFILPALSGAEAGGRENTILRSSSRIRGAITHRRDTTSGGEYAIWVRYSCRAGWLFADGGGPGSDAVGWVRMRERASRQTAYRFGDPPPEGIVVGPKPARSVGRRAGAVPISTGVAP